MVTLSQEKFTNKLMKKNMKKISLLFFMLTIIVVTAVAQPQGRRGMRMMMPDYSNPDSTATAIAKEMKLDEALSAKFIPLYTAYLNEYKKIDELLPMRMPRERGQRPTEEQIQQMRATMETRETVTTEMRKVYDQRFTDLLGAENFAILQNIEKEQMEKRMQEMMKRFQQGGRRGGRFGGGFGGGFQGGNGGFGGGFQGGDGGFGGSDDTNE